MNKCMYCGADCKNQFCNNSCSAKYNNIKRYNPTFIKCSCCGVVLTSSAIKISDGYCSAQCLVKHETKQQSQLPIFHHSKQKGDIGEMVLLRTPQRGITGVGCQTITEMNRRYVRMAMKHPAKVSSRKGRVGSSPTISAEVCQPTITS